MVNDTNRNYLRRKAAATYLGIGLSTLADWQRRRIIPFIKVTHKVCLFRKNDLDAAMDKFRIRSVGDNH